MAASLTEILAALQNGVTAINNLSIQLTTFFPQATSVSTSATAGTITYTSSQAAGWLTVVTSSGKSYKVALYNT